VSSRGRYGHFTLRFSCIMFHREPHHCADSLRSIETGGLVEITCHPGWRSCTTTNVVSVLFKGLAKRWRPGSTVLQSVRSHGLDDPFDGGWTLPLPIFFK
jgi:hypothetical protein